MEICIIRIWNDNCSYPSNGKVEMDYNSVVPKKFKCTCMEKKSVYMIHNRLGSGSWVLWYYTSVKEWLGCGGFSKKLSLQRCVYSLNIVICVKIKIYSYLASSEESSVLSLLVLPTVCSFSLPYLWLLQYSALNIAFLKCSFPATI